MKTVETKTNALWIIAILILTCTGCLEKVEESDANGGADLLGQNLKKSENGLGYQISCVAPMREDYIEANGGDPETKEGDVIALQHTVLFIFDKSGSMDGLWDVATKWENAADAMTFSVGRYSAYVSAGTIFFPTDDSCGVDSITHESQIYFTSANDFLGKWEARMDEKTPNGSTPLEDAFRKADEALAIACQDGIMERPIKVVLIADGQPTCEDNAEVITAFAQKWREQGVMTFVIGLPGSNSASDLLESIASAGGSTEEIIEKREDEIDQDTEITVVTQYDTDYDVDTSGIIAPDNENELENNIAVCVE